MRGRRQPTKKCLEPWLSMDPFIWRPLFSPSPSAQLWPLSLSKNSRKTASPPPLCWQSRFLGETWGIFNCLPLLSTALSRKFLKRLVVTPTPGLGPLCSCLFLWCYSRLQSCMLFFKGSETQGRYLRQRGHEWLDYAIRNSYPRYCFLFKFTFPRWAWSIAYKCQ